MIQPENYDTVQKNIIIKHTRYKRRSVRYEFLSNVIRYLSRRNRLCATDLELLPTVRSVVAKTKWRYQENDPGLSLGKGRLSKS